MSEGLPHKVRSSFPTQKIKNFLDRIEKLLELTGIYGYTVVYRYIMSCPTNEADVDFFVLRTLKIDYIHYNAFTSSSVVIFLFNRSFFCENYSGYSFLPDTTPPSQRISQPFLIPSRQLFLPACCRVMFYRHIVAEVCCTPFVIAAAIFPERNGSSLCVHIV